MISSNGSFKLANCHLDKKALFGMHSYINDCALPPNTCVLLSDKLIEPVSLYGSEVWAPFCLNSRYTNISNKEDLFRKFSDFPGF
jgi:hypothetical protein